MKGLFLLSALTVIVLSAFTAVSYGDTLIYNNSNLTNSGFNPGSYTEFIDYGISSGGKVSKFKFDYWTESSSTGTIWISFYRSTDSSDPGYSIKKYAIASAPATNGYIRTFEYVIPEEDRFDLPNGNFGYSFKMSSSNTYIATASGGAGNKDYFWVYDSDFWDDFVLTYFNTGWSGFSMKVYKGPPINTVTCDISGYKFDDEDSNGEWDDGEPVLSGWQMYIDENGDNAYQASEPNAVTDPNGMYFFENVPSPATYTIREIMQEGWTQTMPGGADYEYTVATEPNNVYGPLNFGNTDEPIETDIKLYGYVKTADGVAISEVRVEIYEGPFTPTGIYVHTDEEGYYEIVVSAPFTGSVRASKDRWKQNSWGVTHTNLLTDYEMDIQMLHEYGGGEGSETEPFQIYTAEQLDFIGRQQSDWNKHYILMNDLDMSASSLTSFHKIFIFSGTFDGQDFTIDDPDGLIRIGLFGDVRDTGIIENLSITNLSMDCGENSGGIASVNKGQIINCHVRGENLGTAHFVGGLVGYNTFTGIIRECSFEGSVSGDQDVGGLVGFNYNGAQILNSYARADVSGRVTRTGGFIGTNQGGIIKDCYCIGEITGDYNNGGFVGENVFDDALIEHCYCIGSVNGNRYTGGFAGGTGFSETVGCVWNIDFGNPPHFGVGHTGANVSDDIEDITSLEMKYMSSYAEWNFDSVWRICDGENYPRLQWEERPVGDFVCPEGVEFNDLMVLCEQWLGEEDLLSADIAPEGAPDGIVDLFDYSLLVEYLLSGVGEE